MIKILKTKKKSNGILEKGSAIPIWEIGSISFLLLLHKMKNCPEVWGKFWPRRKRTLFQEQESKEGKGFEIFLQNSHLDASHICKLHLVLGSVQNLFGLI